MKVLYIRTGNIYDDSRATKEIMALAEKGYQVCVLGWDRDGNAGMQSEKVFKKYESLISVEFFACQIDGGIGIKNIDKLVKWVHWINKQVRKVKGIDVIHLCNLDAAIGVWRYAKRHNIKLVYDIYDYYIDSHVIPGLLQTLIEKLEISVINAADVTIICTEERKEQIAKAHPQRVTVIHNSPEVKDIVFTENKYDYAYCGSLFDQRLLKEIFSEYEKHASMKFAIAGYGEYVDLAKELDHKHQRFNYYGSVTYSEVLRIESEAVVISAIYKPTIRNHRLCAPNKFYEALALAKPVIVCKGTGIDKIVAEHQAGIVIEYDAKQFFEALDFLISNPDVCRKMGANARHLYENEYIWEIMKGRLWKLYDEI